MKQIENGILMKCFVRHNATWKHLQFLVPRNTSYIDFTTCSQFPTWWRLGSEKD